MPKASWSADVSRKIVRRIVVEGNLVLQTPAHFGNGDGPDLVSMPLLTDPQDMKTPLLTGASIAGALRSYVRERQHGLLTRIDSQATEDMSDSVLLFGAGKGNSDGEQSPFIVEDARGENAAIELRDGVRLEGASRTSASDALFTVEMWQAGTTFPLRFELVVRENDNEAALKRALATALTGFDDGSITIGARKRRGHGQASIEGWRVREYDLTSTRDLLDWIANGANRLSGPVCADLVQTLGGQVMDDQRCVFHLQGKFSLEGSLLIRSGTGPDGEQKTAQAANVRPDMLHLHSARPSGTGGTRSQKPIVPGTSLAGALRTRAFKIARLLAGKKKAQTLIESMFGCDMNQLRPGEQPVASRITLVEHIVSGVEAMLVQSRVGIDRFTGGALDGALFSQQPLFGGPHSQVMVDLSLMNPQAYEIGLLLLVLKDLWTCDLPLGGEISVGRGRLQGQCCRLEYRHGQVQRWKLRANGAIGLSVIGESNLEDYVTALHEYADGSRP